MVPKNDGFFWPLDWKLFQKFDVDIIIGQFDVCSLPSFHQISWDNCDKQNFLGILSR